MLQFSKIFLYNNMFRKTLTSLLCMTLPLFAQEKYKVSGTVWDKEQNQAIVGANISLPTNGMGTVTSETGNFIVTLKEGNYKLIIDCLNFKTKELDVTINKNTKLDTIGLEHMIYLSDPINVTPSKDSIKKDIWKNNIKILPKRAKNIIGGLGSDVMLQAIQTQPGPTPIGVGGRYAIKGGYDTEIRNFIDEIPVDNNFHMFGYLSPYSPLNTDKWKSHFILHPLKFGDQLSGVIDVTSRQSNKEKHERSVSLGVLSGELFIGGPLKKIDGTYKFYGRNSLLNRIMPKIKNIDVPTLSESHIKLTSKSTKNLNLILDGIYNMSKSHLCTYKHNSNYFVLSNTLSLKAEQVASPKDFLKLQYVLHSHKSNFKSKGIKGKEYSADMGLNQLMHKFNLSWDHSNSKRMHNAGLEFIVKDNHVKIDNSGLNGTIFIEDGGPPLTVHSFDEDFKQILASAFFENNFNFFGVDVSHGLRASGDLTSKKFVLSPRVQLNYNKFKMGYARMAAFPGNDNFMKNRTPLTKKEYMKLEAEKVHQFMMGAEHEFKLPFGEMLIAVEPYYKKYYDLMEKEKRNSVGCDFVVGFEAPRGGFNLAYTISRTNQNGAPPSFDRTHVVKFLGDYKIFGDKTHLDFTLNLIFATGTPYSPWKIQNGNWAMDGFNSKRFPNHWNISPTLSYGNDTWGVSIGCLNLQKPLWKHENAHGVYHHFNDDGSITREYGSGLPFIPTISSYFNF